MSDVVRGVLEARWKRKISEQHSDFCTCSSYLNHFKKLCTDAGTDPIPDAGTGDDLTDAMLTEGLEAAAAIEAAIAEAE